jgi:hypothetical protein
MAKSKHTPGPWWFGISCEAQRGPVALNYRSGGHYSNPAIFGADGTEIVGCDEYNVFGEVADIRLMIAAPELYAALKLFPGFTDDATVGDIWIEAVRSVLAKVEAA